MANNTKPKTSPKATLNVAVSGDNGEKPEFEVIFLNGVRYEIRKGEDVQVPPAVKDVYNEHLKNLREGNTQKKKLVLEG